MTNPNDQQQHQQQHSSHTAANPTAAQYGSLHYVLLLVGLIIILRIITRTYLSGGKKQNKDLFKIPKEGGVLQNMQRDKDDNIALKLAKKIKITHDTYIFRFAFSNPEWQFGLPIGNHVIFNEIIPTKAKPEGELVCRKYTPISEIDTQGYIDFVIKVYRKDVHPRFPDGGIMSQHMESLEKGAVVHFEGPKGRLTYLGYGEF